MNIKNIISVLLLLLVAQLHAQTEPSASNWVTWFIPSGKTYRLPPPPTSKAEISEVLVLQKSLNKADFEQIEFWNAGSTGYHWQSLMDKIWMTDALKNGILANMLLSVAIYDATVAAWDSKYFHHRKRPFETDKRIQLYTVRPDSPSFPCETSVAAGAASTIIAHFFPALKDSVEHMAKRAMDSRVAAGVAFPSDTRAGFDLGKKIAEAEIERTKGFLNNTPWDGKLPDRAGTWNGKFAMLPNAGTSKTVVLQSGNQFRPGPPPDFSKDMEELRSFKQTQRSMANALRFDNQDVWGELTHKKIFEYNLHLNAPRAARVYATCAIGYYEGFVATWDAKFSYWGIRPEQLDTTFQPLLGGSPPFPGYPSGHAAVGKVTADLLCYFFPADRTAIQKLAKDGAESRFQGGIHFRTDNEVALVLGENVAAAIVEKLKTDGAEPPLGFEKQQSIGKPKQ